MENGQNQTNTEKTSLKCIVVGASGAGKTALTKRLIDNKFEKYTQPTLSVDFKSKEVNINGRNVVLNIYDTAGQEKYSSITQSYLRGADCALVVFDLTDKHSFDDAPKWIKSVKTLSPFASFILVGNKCDLANERVISTADGEQYAKSVSLKYIETSALSSMNVNEAFIRCAEEYIAKNQPQTTQTHTTEPVPIQQQTTKKGCCSF